MINLRHLASISLIISLFFIGQPVYLLTKAQLAQLLLANAWQQTIAQQQDMKPWPWADIHPVAKLEVPALAIDQIVLQGQHGEALAFGPGFQQDQGNLFLAGHRDSHFSFLKKVKINDIIYLTLKNGSKREYRIAELNVFDIQAHRLLIPYQDSLTLITCYPFESLQTSTNKRLAVIAIPTQHSHSPTTKQSVETS